MIVVSVYLLMLARYIQSISFCGSTITMAKVQYSLIEQSSILLKESIALPTGYITGYIADFQFWLVWGAPLIVNMHFYFSFLVLIVLNVVYIVILCFVLGSIKLCIVMWFCWWSNVSVFTVANSVQCPAT